MDVVFGVLGPVTAWDGSGDELPLKGPRHRAVLARLIIARGRVVPVSRLVDDLWDVPPADAVGAVRTFVAALRRALEPERPSRAPSRLLVTEGPGYALRTDAVDAWRFERVVSAPDGPPKEALTGLDEALGWWRGPAYAEFADDEWAHAERSRLNELRLRAIERRAEAKLDLGLATEAVPDLDAHVAEHPWREDAWRLLALALYRTGRQGDALAVLRRARALLVEQLGIDPSPALRRLEESILRQEDPDTTSQVWAEAAFTYDRTVAAGSRARLESTVGILRNLAVTGGGGLEAARGQRMAAIAAAERLGEAELTARVIGAYDVPAIWTRSDDPPQAAEVVSAAERALAALPDGPGPARARLLATIALESRGSRGGRAREAAAEAERLARNLDDPALLAFALNGVFMQTFHRAGLAPERDDIGAELIDIAVRHDLPSFLVLGHLVRMQARSALADFPAADEHAAAADRLAERHERPLVGVFSTWYRALRLAASDQPQEEVEAAYRDAIARLDGSGMPGLAGGLPALARLSLRIREGRPAQTEPHTDWGPYEPWTRPLVLVAQQRPREAAAALRKAPEPPRDLLFEAMWCLLAQAAMAVDDKEMMARARDTLAPAAGELAGAGSGLLTFGPVTHYLRRADG
ncbi:SARP family transcriptional regulator [Actinomadura sp. GC306]|uniref:AfsR/SARP family transcriptional regulator n=1 Tax=Actinomadura sp. GC306 TaxID=2530367 RepID=UPI001047CBAB|nr:BTAD domain-containing putative transcriptional regulator [Actinomadura sp. GC306]TDC64355.1 SARP family transcriptional regulator [Actinomadura sp. GC306]